MLPQREGEKKPKTIMSNEPRTSSDSVRAVRGEARPKCATCANPSALTRLNHHWTEYRYGKLAAHLVEVYGEEYKNSGRMDKRLNFVRESYRIYHEEWKPDKHRYKMAEAFDLALIRVRATRSKSVGIERSAPREEE